MDAANRVTVELHDEAVPGWKCTLLPQEHLLQLQGQHWKPEVLPLPDSGSK